MDLVQDTNFCPTFYIMLIGLHLPQGACAISPCPIKTQREDMIYLLSPEQLLFYKVDELCL